MFPLFKRPRHACALFSFISLPIYHLYYLQHRIKSPFIDVFSTHFPSHQQQQPSLQSNRKIVKITMQLEYELCKVNDYIVILQEGGFAIAKKAYE